MTTTARPGDVESAQELPSDSERGTLVLEHAYRIERRLETGPFFATWSARQTPFEREVQVRFYEGIEGLGLSPEAHERLRSHIAAGADGGWATDVGELESGDPFLVLTPPSGQLLAAWWGSSARSTAAWSELLRGLRELLQRLEPAQRRELSLHRLYVATGSTERALRLSLYALGDHPTRAEVREMTGLVTPELARAFPPECFLPENTDVDGLEEGDAADVWRVGAVVSALSGAAHPLFPDGCDVAEVVAGLVGGMASTGAVADTGEPSLRERLTRAESLDPEQRPTLEALCSPLQEASDEDEDAEDAALAASMIATEPDPDLDQAPPTGPQLPRWFSGIMGILAVGLIVVATYLLSNQPPTSTAVVITSDPDGVRFEQVTEGGRVVDLGRTPVMIDSTPIDASLSIRPVYEDGQIGETQTLTPDRLELFEACRRLHVQFDE